MHPEFVDTAPDAHADDVVITQMRAAECNTLAVAAATARDDVMCGRPVAALTAVAYYRYYYYSVLFFFLLRPLRTRPDDTRPSLTTVIT